MILYDKGAFARTYLLLLVINGTVLVTEAEFVTMSFEEEVGS